MDFLTIFSTNSHIIVSMIFATISGALIGYTREKMNRPAGIRTHAILSLGSSILTYMSMNTFYIEGTGDPGRVTAQIVSGIGFLGAGTILKYQNKVKGLTTAATLWISAAIGISFGAEEYFIGWFSTGLTFIVAISNSVIKKRKRDTLTIQVDLKSKKYINSVVEVLLKYHVKLKELDYEESNDKVFYLTLTNVIEDKIPYVKKDLILLEGIENVIIHTDDDD
ncbi:MgtC/SapB family protein [Oceanotoga teriensis]|uniref:MgtC/SapB family protein n=1 Tax=Oceanotoga teriensis TaxID=515440 RepID=UPI0027133B59|nr:MgtC/SapB family protein [Oceanotoga teriensis]MDO7975938.1 MgtC/SapB family protein [Oceanotoga teriensis]